MGILLYGPDGKEKQRQKGREGRGRGGDQWSARDGPPLDDRRVATVVVHEDVRKRLGVCLLPVEGLAR